MPKRLRDYYIKNKVDNMTQWIEIVQIGFSMVRVKMIGFKMGNASTKTMIADTKESKNSKETSKKENKERKFRLLRRAGPLSLKKNG